MLMFTKKRLLIVLWLCLLMIFTASCSSSADQMPDAKLSETEYKKMEKLNGLAEQFYTNVNEGKIEEARAGIIELNKQVTNIHFKGAASPEGVEALMETMITAKQVLTSFMPSMNEAIVSAAKVRLAVDALTHPKHPMWLHYYKILKEDGNQLVIALEQQQEQHVNQAMNQMMKHYEVIRPAVLINREPSEVMKMDSYLKFLMNEPNISAMSQYDDVLNELFHRKSSTAYLELEQQQNPFLWTAALGAIIITVLSYVGWRKYQYEQNHLSVRKERKQERN